MEIEVWSQGHAKWTADEEYQDPMIREAVDQRGDVAGVIVDYTDSERSDISHDDYARVTSGDLVLWQGWVTGDPDAPPPAGAPVTETRQVAPEPTPAVASDLADDFYFERKQVTALRAVLGEIFTCFSTGDCTLHDDEQVAEWRERSGMDDL